MAVVLHLFKGPDATLARRVVAQQTAAGDRVTVALLPGSVVPQLPPGVSVRRLDGDLTYSQLLDLIFDGDHVITW